MRLRTRSRLAALVATLVFLALLGLFLLAYRGKLQTQRDLAVTESLSVQIAQLRTELFGYLLHPQLEPRAQVQAQFRVLQGLLERQAPAIDDSIRDDEQTRYAWESVRRLVGEGHALFVDLGGARTDPRLAERDARTADLILADSHSLILYVNQIRYRASERFLRASSWENLTLGALLAGIAGLGLTLFAVFERMILAPVQELYRAALGVAGGELSLRLKSPRRDEFGEMAAAFDGMLDQLQETTVSRARLEVEIAERAQVQRALQETEDWFQLALEVSRSFAFEWEPASDQVRRSTSSGAILGLTGAVVEHDTGQAYFQRVAPADRERFVAMLRRLQPGNDRYHTDYRLTRGDGQTVVLEETARAFFDPAGRLQSLVGATTDITERRQAEAEVQRLNADLEVRVQQRTAELQSANRELESFAYAVSHDLRAPLRALSGFSQALVEDYGPRLDGEALVFLDQIQSASHRMGELIDGILTLSRSTRGELRREPVDLGAAAHRLLLMERAAAPTRQVTWELAAGLEVFGDPAMLDLVMVNLIDNAWKYTSKTFGAIIRVYGEERDGVRWFCVADNGAGFDMAYAERLFKPFQRLHRQDEFPGIGIGLATVQRIISRHGGTITADGVPGGGATFRFTLPATSGRTETV
ncbi:ATP-binding protein [uncultured Thiodictyon sp.]|uniref:ATP-binding protein n=1 Tax=uncultured Thiodictyon sp. TaxID=1846217 RepID=UPI0025EE6030|nr:ATP-binding protein [uncultured Thiodictyon sp.]